MTIFLLSNKFRESLREKMKSLRRYWTGSDGKNKSDFADQALRQAQKASVGGTKQRGQKNMDQKRKICPNQKNFRFLQAFRRKDIIKQ